MPITSFMRHMLHKSYSMASRTRRTVTIEPREQRWIGPHGGSALANDLYMSSANRPLKKRCIGRIKRGAAPTIHNSRMPEQIILASLLGLAYEFLTNPLTPRLPR